MAEFPPLTVHRVVTTTDGQVTSDLLEYSFDAADPSLSYADSLGAEWIDRKPEAQVAEMQGRYARWLAETRKPPADTTVEDLNQAVADAAQAALDAQRTLLDAQSAVLDAGGTLEVPVAVTTIPDAAVVDTSARPVEAAPEDT